MIKFDKLLKSGLMAYAVFVQAKGLTNLDT